MRNVVLSAAMACLGTVASGEAAIIVGNTGTSGQLVGVEGNESGAFSFNNNGEFLAVTLNAVSNSGLSNANVAMASVSYNGAALTLAHSSVQSGDVYSAVFYLKNPTVGDATLAVDFQSSIFNVNAGNWEIGALSLSNVDEEAPIASFKTLANGPSLPYSETMTSVSAGAVSDGDLLVMVVGAQNSYTMPNYQTATSSASTFYARTSAPQSGNRQYDAATALLTTGDLTGVGGDELVLSQVYRRAGARTAVVFNAIPEPASLSLLGLAGLFLRRRR